MNRKEAAELLPIIKAFSEGKVIQTSVKGKPWEDLGENITFYTNDKYRFHPEPTYRPFKDAEECWAEMQKHQPFGWVKFKDTESGYYMLTGIARGVGVGINDSLFSYDRVFDDYTFADGLPFGVKEEE